VSEVDFAEEARRVEGEADNHQEVVEVLRGDKEYREALLEQGGHREKTGISVCDLSHWKEQRKEAVDTHHFDYLLREIMEAELVFWKHYCEYDIDHIFVTAVLNGDANISSDSPKNIVKTWKWLTEEIDAPEELERKQHRLGGFAGGGNR